VGLFGYVQDTPERMEQSKWQTLAAQTTSCLLKMKKKKRRPQAVIRSGSIKQLRALLL
jgi:hypothetical protein